MGKPITVNRRAFGSITVVELVESGAALVIVPPLQNGRPDLSERATREWRDMVTELEGAGYYGAARLEPDGEEQIPLTMDGGAIITGTVETHWLYKSFDHYSLDLVERHPSSATL